MTVEELKEQIKKANDAYRIGQPIISDYEHDKLIDELSIISPNDELLNKIGFVINDEVRKSILPIPMFSMDKVKTITELENWVRIKGISKLEYVVITPKLDGVSLLVKEVSDNCYTRGNGEYGQKSDEHYKLIQNHLHLKNNPFKYTNGELIMSKEIFNDKYSEYANPRNYVAGLINSPKSSLPLKDCQYIKYGAVPNDIMDFKNKTEILDELNNGQDVNIQYHICKLADLTEDLLINLFHKWRNEYNIDGVVVEINNLNIQRELGRESSGNPAYARAFKHESFIESTNTEVIGVSWGISKQGLLKPVIHINPVELDGVTISNITGNNARFMKDNGIGVGAIITIIRSGMVIPKVIDVIKSVEFITPTIDGVEIIWNGTGAELITLNETDFQILKKNIAFFQILEAENVSEGIITQLWEAGYKTIKDILELKKYDLEKIDRFGSRKSEIVYDSIQKSVTNVQLSKLQHATSIFKGLGSKKLVLLENFDTKPTLEQIMTIDGFAEISAQSYIDGYDEFYDFIKDLPITIEKKKDVIKINNDFDNDVFVFTGVRDKEIEKLLIERGAKIGTSISKNTTHLVCKNINSGSSKETKAISLGIKVMTLDQLKDIINK